MTHTNNKPIHHMPLSQELTSLGLVVVGVLLLVVAGYGYVRVATLSKQVQTLAVALASTTAIFQNSINDATTTFDTALQQERQNVQAQLGNVQDQVGSVTGTVSDLQKLSAIDPELLAKYSKVFFLSDTYAPARLVEIPTQYAYNETTHLQIVPEVLPFLQRLLDQAKNDNIDLFVSSAYRSFSTQSALKGQYRVTYGAGTANSFSADQGYSEHQLGTAVDFITTGTGGALLGFDKRPAYTWLLANAYRFGFVISYPQNNGSYIFEPWHWRFVGVKLATDLHRSNSYFYSMDQRTIDTYLISLFD